MSGLPEVIDHTTTPQRPTQSELARFEALGLAVIPLHVLARYRAAEKVCFAMMEWIPDATYAGALEDIRRQKAVRDALLEWYELAYEVIREGEAIK
ncbi:MAG: hypothetical protein IRZ07_30795 [Microbispora sp.]|nr:hypothetical protein [Microbispora sp.]